MRRNQFIIIKKKRSPIKTVLIVVSSIVAVGAALAAAYCFLKDKFTSEILGRIDINGDGEADAIMLDTTGNGEIDTIIINSEPESEEE